MKVMSSNNKKSIMMARSLILWLYLKTYLSLAEIFLDGTVVSYLYYAFVLILLVIIVIRSGMIINKRLLFFLLTYLLVVVINSSVVSYYKYVLIEGITSVIIFTVPFFIISNKYFEFEIFINKWIVWAKYNSIVVLLYIILNRINLIGYGVFAGLTLPNIIILSYAYALKKYKGVNSVILICFNILATIMFSGRMAAVASVITFILCIIICERHKFKKIIWILLSSFGVTVIIYKLEYFIGIGIYMLGKIGMHSRTLYLLQEQLQKGNLFENIYMTNREYIYSLGLEYIENRNGLPGGFAVIRNLTEGKYYHAHNLVLELLIFFGVVGTIALIGIIIYRYTLVTKYKNKNIVKFCSILCGFYFIYSLSGSSFLDSFASILIVGILFFYRGNR